MVADPPYHSYNWFPSRRWFQKNGISFVQFPPGFEGLCGVPPWWGQKSYKMNTFTNRLLKGKIWRWFSKSKVFIIILALVCFVWIWWGHFGVGVSKMGRPRKKKSNSTLLGWIGMGLKFLHIPLPFIQMVPTWTCLQTYEVIVLLFLEGFGGLCGAPPLWSQKSYKMNTFT